MRTYLFMCYAVLTRGNRWSIKYERLWLSVPQDVHQKDLTLGRQTKSLEELRGAKQQWEKREQELLQQIAVKVCSLALSHFPCIQRVMRDLRAALCAFSKFQNCILLSLSPHMSWNFFIVRLCLLVTAPYVEQQGSSSSRQEMTQLRARCKTLQSQVERQNSEFGKLQQKFDTLKAEHAKAEVRESINVTLLVDLSLPTVLNLHGQMYQYPCFIHSMPSLICTYSDAC